MQAMSASLLEPNDVAIVITHSGSSRDIVDAIELAHEAGAASIVITSHFKSPVSHVASVVLSVNTLETNYRFEPMSSRIAHLSVVDAIAVGVTLRRQDAYMRSVEKTRRALVKKRY